MTVFRFARARATACLLAFAAPVAVPVPRLPEPAALRWSLGLPLNDKVVFRGVVSFDQAGIAPANMMYPAPNAAGLLAAVLTHAALAKGSRDAQKTKMTTEADKVLAPYQDVLETFGYPELAQRSKPLTTMGTQMPVVPHGAAHADTWLVLVTPVFSMTQDQTTLVLDNTVAMYAPGETKHATYTNAVRVISDARKTDEPLKTWTADSGELLKDESAHLLAASLDIAFVDAEASPAIAEFRTLRYMEGGAERMERGQQISEHCDRVLLRSLRGSLMSVPVHHAASTPTAEECRSAGSGDVAADTASTTPSTPIAN